MLKVFVSGPYRAPTEDGVYQNIQYAREVAKKLWARGHAVFCPHLNSMFMGGTAEDKVFLDGCLAWLEHADYIVMLKGWEKSAGATAELEEADRLGITAVFEADGELEVALR